MEIDIENLHSAAIGIKPVDYDWMKGYGEQWEIPFEQTDEELDNGDWDPMMSYYYLIPEYEQEISDDELKERLGMAGSITLVYFIESNTYALALSGGGMDLSWDICRAFIFLGYLPPTHFCRLPQFAGMDFSRPENAIVLAACHRSLEVKQNWNEGDKNDLLRVAPKPEETVFQF